jgi:hypothetical protein
MLAHGPLSQDFAGEQEIKTFGAKPRPGLAQHEDMAVNAGIVAPAQAMGRIKQQGHEIFGNINYVQGQVQEAGGLPGALRAKKRGDKGDAGHLNTLGPEHRGGQHAVQAAGKQAQAADAFALLVSRQYSVVPYAGLQDYFTDNRQLKTENRISCAA